MIAVTVNSSGWVSITETYVQPEQVSLHGWICWNKNAIGPQRLLRWRRTFLLGFSKVEFLLGVSATCKQQPWPCYLTEEDADVPAEQMQEASTHELSGQKTLVRSAYLTKAHGCFVVLGTDKFLLEWNDVRLGWFCLHYVLLHSQPCRCAACCECKTWLSIPGIPNMSSQIIKKEQETDVNVIAIRAFLQFDAAGLDRWGRIRSD